MRKATNLHKHATILIAGACNFPNAAGGAVRCMHMLAKGFASNGHNVEVISTYGSEKRKRCYSIDGFKARSFGYASLDSQDNTFLRNAKIHCMLFGHLLKRTLSNDYDILLFYGPVVSFTLVASIAAITNRFCVYLHADIEPTLTHMNVFRQLKCLLSNITDIVLAKLANLIVILGTSQLVQRYVHYAPTSPRIQILAPIDTAVFAGGNGVNFKEKFKLHGKQIVTYCGTVDTLEGVDILLQAMGIIKREHSNIALVIAGHVSDYDRVVGGKRNYKKLAEELAVSRCTIFTGHLPMNDVIDLLSASDVLVMPKINHPMNNVASPIKIAEYLAAGRPVVASNICELDNHLKHLVHLVFCEPGNINDLVCALVSVLNDYTLRHTLSSNASAIATTLFDYRHIAKTIYEYTSTIKEATFK